jgi:hypothetical protein
LDVRDCKGKWLAAEIVKTRCAAAAAAVSSLQGGDQGGGVEHVLVHYIGWSNRWDEWLELSSGNRSDGGGGNRSHYGGPGKDDERIAPLGLFTTTAVTAGSDMGNKPPPVYALGDQVVVYYNAPLPRAWARGVITQIDGLQCSVRYEPTAAAAAASFTKGSNAGNTGAFQRWFHARSDEIEIDRTAQPADARA